MRDKIELIRMTVLVLAAITAGTRTGRCEDPYSSIQAIESLPNTNASAVTVRATLTLNGTPAYIQDSTGGATVDGLAVQGLRIGDELLITGHPEVRNTGLLLHVNQAQLLWHSSPMPPLSVTPDEAALGKFAAVLIEASGRLVDTEIVNGERWLRLESGHQVFLARLNGERGSSLLPQIENDSVLRLRGVCSLQPGDTRYQGGFAILLRSAEDVTVVSGPPWWSPKHLAELGILFAALIVAGHLALVQTLKARFKAIMAERARLGHELHDTLAQSFAGLSFQLQAARKIVPPASGSLTRHLDLALDMVRHSHSEAHRSIMMLRPQSLADGSDLHSAIQDSLEQSIAGCQLEAKFTSKGATVRLPLLTTDTLYRIAQEAIANALRHGRPSRLEVNLDYVLSSVCLTVMDDGVGFDAKAVHGRGFGLAGMQERVRALRGNFSVTSEPGQGTVVRAEIYLRHTAGARLISALHAWRAFYWERIYGLFQSKKRRTL